MLLTLLSTLLALAPVQANPRPDVMVILVDDIGWRDIDATVPTPTIDGLARRGLTLTRAYAEPYCSPARFALMFGLNPWREKMGTWIQPWLPGEVTADPSRLSIAQHLKNNGYATGAFGKWHMSSVAVGFPAAWDWPRRFGFDTWRAGRLDNMGFMTDYTNWNRIDDGVETWTTEYNTTAIARSAADWWRTTTGPKFAYVAFQAGHAPWHVPPANLLPPGYNVGASLRSQFEADVVALDTEIGNLLSVVDLSKTLVVFASDNGTAIPATNQIGNHQKGTCYEGGVRVPMIVAGPGVPAGRSTDSIVHLMDLFKTISDYAHLPRPVGPHALDSISFFPLLSGPGRSRAWLYVSEFAPNGSGPYTEVSRAVVSQRYKLIDRGGVQSLFDVIVDPDELHPIPLGMFPNVYGILRFEMDGQIARGAP